MNAKLAKITVYLAKMIQIVKDVSQDFLKELKMELKFAKNVLVLGIYYFCYFLYFSINIYLISIIISNLKIVKHACLVNIFAKVVQKGFIKPVRHVFLE